MSESDPSPVLLCTDGSDPSIAALAAGLRVVRSDVPLVVVTVVESPDDLAVTGDGFAGGVMSPAEYEQERAAVREEGEAIASSVVRALGLTGAETRVVEGSPGPTICDLAGELGAQAIVLGSRGRGGLRRAVLGSVSDHVVRRAPCPVVVSNDHTSEAHD